MRYELLLLIFVFTMVLTPSTLAQESCEKDLTVYIQFKAFDGDNSKEISDYQAPNFKEDDLLSLWKIVVLNDGTCKSSEAELKLNLTNDKESIDHFFCEYQISIPSIEPGNSYNIIRDGFDEKNLDNGQTVQLPFYLDSNGKNFTTCSITLLTTGLWEGMLSLEATKPDENIGTWSSAMLTDENNAEHLRFKVRPKQEILSLEYQRTSLYVVAIIGILTILIMYLTSKKQVQKMEEQYDKQTKKEDEREERKQLSLLDSLYSELCAIGDKKHRFKLIKDYEMTGNLHWFKELLGWEGILPGHGIWYLTTSLYIGGLNKEVKGIETDSLKKMIILINQKIDLINNHVVTFGKDKNKDRKEFREAVIKIIDEALKYVLESKKFIENNWKLKKENETKRI